MLQIHCKTPLAILLAAIKDKNGQIWIPSEKSQTWPGLHLAVKPLLPINEQLTVRLTAALTHVTWQRLDIYQEFAEIFTLPNEKQATLYLASIPELTSIPKDDQELSWLTLPDLMRTLEKSKRRLPYLKAWQVLSGGLSVDTKAIEAGDAELAEILRRRDH